MDSFVHQNILENEQKIVEQAKKDDKAFEILYNHYFPRIYGYIFKRTGNHPDAEDIVSEVFMKAFTHIGSYKNQGNTFGAWVYRIATNNLTDYYRKKSKNKSVGIEQADFLESKDPLPDELIDKLMDSEKIKLALEKMPKRYKQAVHLKYFAELSTCEIGEVLKISENNARVLMFRALKKFNEIYSNLS